MADRAPSSKPGGGRGLDVSLTVPRCLPLIGRFSIPLREHDAVLLTVGCNTVPLLEQIKVFAVGPLLELVKLLAAGLNAAPLLEPVKSLAMVCVHVDKVTTGLVEETG